jgi:AAA family ATP:ADP antiporter
MTPARLLRRLVLLDEGEAPALLWSALYFFLLLFGFYLLRPVREAMGIARGADKLPWLMTGTLLAMALANPAFAALVSRLPRRRFIPRTYRFFALNMLAFFLAFRLLPNHGGAALGYAFYIWLSVFNLFVVSVFWGLMSDVWTEVQGKRLFGFIAMGGTLGAIAGAAVTGALTKGVALGGLALKVEPLSLLLLSMLTLELAVQCVKRLAAIFHLGDVAHGEREPGPGLLEGLRLIATSRYLQLICAYMLLFTVTSTFLYLEQGRIVAGAFRDTASRTAAFAQLDLWVNVLTLATQVFLTGRLRGDGPLPGAAPGPALRRGPPRPGDPLHPPGPRGTLQVETLHRHLHLPRRRPAGGVGPGGLRRPGHPPGGGGGGLFGAVAGSQPGPGAPGWIRSSAQGVGDLAVPVASREAVTGDLMVLEVEGVGLPEGPEPAGAVEAEVAGLVQG